MNTPKKGRRRFITRENTWDLPCTDIHEPQPYIQIRRHEPVRQRDKTAWTRNRHTGSLEAPEYECSGRSETMETGIPPTGRQPSAPHTDTSRVMFRYRPPRDRWCPGLGSVYDKTEGYQKPDDSYSTTRMSELDPGRVPKDRLTRPDSSGSEYSLPGSVCSLPCEPISHIPEVGNIIRTGNVTDLDRPRSLYTTLPANQLLGSRQSSSLRTSPTPDGRHTTTDHRPADDPSTGIVDWSPASRRSKVKPPWKDEHQMETVRESSPLDPLNTGSQTVTEIKRLFPRTLSHENSLVSSVARRPVRESRNAKQRTIIPAATVDAVGPGTRSSTNRARPFTGRANTVEVLTVTKPVTHAPSHETSTSHMRTHPAACPCKEPPQPKPRSSDTSSVDSGIRSGSVETPEKILDPIFGRALDESVNHGLETIEIALPRPTSTPARTDDLAKVTLGTEAPDDTICDQGEQPPETKTDSSGASGDEQVTPSEDKSTVEDSTSKCDVEATSSPFDADEANDASSKVIEPTEENVFESKVEKPESVNNSMSPISVSSPTSIISKLLSSLSLTSQLPTETISTPSSVDHCNQLPTTSVSSTVMSSLSVLTTVVPALFEVTSPTAMHTTGQTTSVVNTSPPMYVIPSESVSHVPPEQKPDTTAENCPSLNKTNVEIGNRNMCVVTTTDTIRAPIMSTVSLGNNVSNRRAKLKQQKAVDLGTDLFPDLTVALAEFSKLSGDPVDLLDNINEPLTSNLTEEIPKKTSERSNRLLVHDDSFNRPDSPEREPMPLPKDSVIARYRRNRSHSSSSSDSLDSFPRSPRLSPRVRRKQKPRSSHRHHYNDQQLKQLIQLQNRQPETLEELEMLLQVPMLLPGKERVGYKEKSTDAGKRSPASDRRSPIGRPSDQSPSPQPPQTVTKDTLTLQPPAPNIHPPELKQIKPSSSENEIQLSVSPVDKIETKSSSTTVEEGRQLSVPGGALCPSPEDTLITSPAEKAKLPENPVVAIGTKTDTTKPVCPNPVSDIIKPMKFTVTETAKTGQSAVTAPTAAATGLPKTSVPPGIHTAAVPVTTAHKAVVSPVTAAPSTKATAPGDMDNVIRVDAPLSVVRVSPRLDALGFAEGSKYGESSSPRPGSTGTVPSDSSSISSRKGRRRFRKRELEANLQSGVEELRVRPGKKDKSDQRKSCLNVGRPGEPDQRHREDSLSSDDSLIQQLPNISSGPLPEGICHPQTHRPQPPASAEVPQIQRFPEPIKDKHSVTSGKSDLDGLRGIASTTVTSSTQTVHKPHDTIATVEAGTSTRHVLPSEKAPLAKSPTNVVVPARTPATDKKEPVSQPYSTKSQTVQQPSVSATSVTKRPSLPKQLASKNQPLSLPSLAPSKIVASTAVASTSTSLSSSVTSTSATAPVKINSGAKIQESKPLTTTQATAKVPVPSVAVSRATTQSVTPVTGTSQTAATSSGQTAVKQPVVSKSQSQVKALPSSKNVTQTTAVSKPQESSTAPTQAAAKQTVVSKPQHQTKTPSTAATVTKSTEVVGKPQGQITPASTVISKTQDQGKTSATPPVVTKSAGVSTPQPTTTPKAGTTNPVTSGQTKAPSGTETVSKTTGVTNPQVAVVKTTSVTKSRDHVTVPSSTQKAVTTQAPPAAAITSTVQHQSKTPLATESVTKTTVDLTTQDRHKSPATTQAVTKTTQSGVQSKVPSQQANVNQRVVDKAMANEEQKPSKPAQVSANNTQGREKVVQGKVTEQATPAVPASVRPSSSQSISRPQSAQSVTVKAVPTVALTGTSTSSTVTGPTTPALTSASAKLVRTIVTPQAAKASSVGSPTSQDSVKYSRPVTTVTGSESITPSTGTGETVSKPRQAEKPIATTPMTKTTPSVTRTPSNFPTSKPTSAAPLQQSATTKTVTSAASLQKPQLSPTKEISGTQVYVPPQDRVAKQQPPGESKAVAKQSKIYEPERKKSEDTIFLKLTESQFKEITSGELVSPQSASSSEATDTSSKSGTAMTSPPPSPVGKITPAEISSSAPAKHLFKSASLGGRYKATKDSELVIKETSEGLKLPAFTKPYSPSMEFDELKVSDSGSDKAESLVENPSVAASGDSVVRRRPRMGRQPDEELAKILNRRSNYLEDWETQASEGVTDYEKQIEEYEMQLAAKKEIEEIPVIDNQLKSVLKARKAKVNEEEAKRLKEMEEQAKSAKKLQKTKSEETVTKRTVQPQQALTRRATVHESSQITAPRQQSSVIAVKSTVSQPETKIQSPGDDAKTQTSEMSISVKPGFKKSEEPPIKIAGIELGNDQTSSERSQSQRRASLDTHKESRNLKRRAKPLLRRAQTLGSANMDPELANILAQRRSKYNDEEDEENEDKQTPPPTENTNKESTEDGEDVEHNVSVAERIFIMEAQSEEDQYIVSAPVRSLTSSGISTPSRLRPFRPEYGSPKGGLVSPSASMQPPSPILEDEQTLLDKLADVAIVRDAAAERRRRFKHMSRDDKRRRTQPITLDEIQEADSLDSVAAFRAEIFKKASLYIFDQSKNVPKPVRRARGREVYPQPFRREKLKDRRTNPRYKTLPLTLTELNEIPESAPVTPKTPKFNEDQPPFPAAEPVEDTIEQIPKGLVSKTLKQMQTGGRSQKSISIPSNVDQRDEQTEPMVIHKLPLQSLQTFQPKAKQIQVPQIEMSEPQADETRDADSSVRYKNEMNKSSQPPNQTNKLDVSPSAVRQTSPRPEVREVRPSFPDPLITDVLDLEVDEEDIDSDEEFDRLVEINYKQLTEAKAKPKVAPATSIAKAPAKAPATSIAKAPATSIAKAPAKAPATSTAKAPAKLSEPVKAKISVDQLDSGTNFPTTPVPVPSAQSTQVPAKRKEEPSENQKGIPVQLASAATKVDVAPVIIQEGICGGRETDLLPSKGQNRDVIEKKPEAAVAKVALTQTQVDKNRPKLLTKVASVHVPPVVASVHVPPVVTDATIPIKLKQEISEKIKVPTSQPLSNIAKEKMETKEQIQPMPKVTSEKILTAKPTEPQTKVTTAKVVATKTETQPTAKITSAKVVTKEAAHPTPKITTEKVISTKDVQPVTKVMAEPTPKVIAGKVATSEKAQPVPTITSTKVVTKDPAQPSPKVTSTKAVTMEPVQLTSEVTAAKAVSKQTAHPTPKVQAAKVKETPQPTPKVTTKVVTVESAPSTPKFVTKEPAQPTPKVASTKVVTKEQAQPLPTVTSTKVVTKEPAQPTPKVASTKVVTKEPAQPTPKVASTKVVTKEPAQPTPKVASTKVVTKEPAQPTPKVASTKVVTKEPAQPTPKVASTKVVTKEPAQPTPKVASTRVVTKEPAQPTPKVASTKVVTKEPVQPTPKVASTKVVTKEPAQPTPKVASTKVVTKEPAQPTPKVASTKVVTKEPVQPTPKLASTQVVTKEPAQPTPIVASTKVVTKELAQPTPKLASTKVVTKEPVQPTPKVSSTKVVTKEPVQPTPKVSSTKVVTKEQAQPTPKVSSTKVVTKEPAQPTPKVASTKVVTKEPSQPTPKIASTKMVTKEPAQPTPKVVTKVAAQPTPKVTSTKMVTTKPDQTPPKLVTKEPAQPTPKVVAKEPPQPTPKVTSTKVVTKEPAQPKPKVTATKMVTKEPVQVMPKVTSTMVVPQERVQTTPKITAAKKLAEKPIQAMSKVTDAKGFSKKSNLDSKVIVEKVVTREQTESEADGEPEDEMSKMSMSEKLQKFHQLEDKYQEGAKGKGNRKFLDRKKRLERQRTQPVTQEEVVCASAFAKQQRSEQAEARKSAPEAAEARKPTSETVAEAEKITSVAEANVSEAVSPTSISKLEMVPSQPEVTRQTSEPVAIETPQVERAKLTLAEKRNLFLEKKGQVAAPPAKAAPVSRRRGKRLQSRYQTQPVTTEEVAKARVSPLAMSLVKQPDAELLENMSLKEQREFMKDWTREALGQTRPTQINRTEIPPDSLSPTKRESQDEETEDKKPKGILKLSESHQPEVKSILKSPQSQGEENKKVKGILKPDITHVEEVKSILRTDIDHADDVKSILKTDIGAVETELRETPRHGILKKESPPPEKPETKGILKKDSSFETPKTEPEKGVLKRASSFDNKSLPEKGVLKKQSSYETKTEPEKGVLKKESSFEVKLEIDLKQERGTDGERTDSILKEPPKTLSHETHHSILKIKPISQTDEPDGLVTKDSKPVETVTSQGESVTMTTRTSNDVNDALNKESAVEEDKLRRPKNEAVARRRMQREARKSDDRYRSQPFDATGSGTTRDSPERARARPVSGHSRHFTQPITTTEKNEAQTVAQPVHKVGGSVSDRLAALRKSGEEEWKKKVARPQSDIVEEVRLRDKSSLHSPRPSSLADRLNLLEGSQGMWKARVEEKDTKQFTVEGKMTQSGKKKESPLLRRKGRTPRAPLSRDLQSTLGGDTGVRVSAPTLPAVRVSDNETPKRATVSAPVMKLASPTEETATESDEGPTRVQVPRADDETFTAFYQTKTEKKSEAKVEVKLEDFDDLVTESNDVLSHARKVRPQRRRAAASKNPVKALAERQDLQDEYTEVRTDVAQRELRRIKREQIAGTAHFAQDALAGLASKENFSKVNLRKTDSFTASTPGGTSVYTPYKDNMLLIIKGRRNCQTRLIEPLPESINSGDCFILITPQKVFVWLGEFSNVIEKAKASELASLIYQRRDLGCKCPAEPVIIPEKKQNAIGATKNFFKALGGQNVQDPGSNDEDEIYEECMMDLNMVYILLEDKLAVCDEYWGKPLKHEMLKSKETFVFDFGSEMYVWTGKQAPFTKRKIAIRLAKELWEKGYDYSDCDITPFSHLSSGDREKVAMKSDYRPDWCLFGKVNENMETLLFKEKFIDWPDSSSLIKIKSEEIVGEIKTDTAPHLQPYDAKKLIAVDMSPVSLILECSHVGRGDYWVEMYDGIRREFEILTLALDIWHILEYERMVVPPSCHGQFHEGDTYVIRWKYRISQTGLKNLKGKEARRSLTGRERYAYFFWQGKHSGVTEKGASALMTVEIDEERGPQVSKGDKKENMLMRVEQNKETPCFLSLFKGAMITHIGKREEEETNTQGTWRFYMVRNELPSEVYLMELPCAIANLRSRTSFLLINVITGMLYIWHGAKSATHIVKRAKEIAARLKKSPPLEIGLHKKVTTLLVREMEEGAERSDFWVAMETKDRSAYHCLFKDPKPYDYTPRLFYITSVKGVFEATEILNPARQFDYCCPFPFLQSDLYKASQPALFMVDIQSEVYVWQGWWPDTIEEEENVHTGSAEARFQVDKRCALETTLQYCKEKNPSNPSPAYLIYAGLEPLMFTNLFPYWKHDEKAEEANLRDGRKHSEVVNVTDLLNKLTRTKYTWAELQERPLPEGIDPLKIESYLEDAEFEERIGMTRDAFKALPGWKKGNIKKELGLF